MSDQSDDRSDLEKRKDELYEYISDNFDENDFRMYGEWEKNYACNSGRYHTIVCDYSSYKKFMGYQSDEIDRLTEVQVTFGEMLRIGIEKGYLTQHCKMLYHINKTSGFLLHEGNFITF